MQPRDAFVPQHVADLAAKIAGRPSQRLPVRRPEIPRHRKGTAAVAAHQPGSSLAGNAARLRHLVRLRKVSRNTLSVALQRSWQALETGAELRRQAAERLLGHLMAKIPAGTRGKDIQVATTAGDLLAALTGDALLKGAVRDPNKLMERALLWLHEQEVLILGKGLTVFRPAMTVHLAPGGGQFLQKDYAPLEEHYAEQTLQTHVMAAYAETGLGSMDDALRLSGDYFLLGRDDFLKRWMPGRGTEIRRQTTGRSWKLIVESLGNPVQQKIVADDREQTNVLVLAGPGSGKTRVLVHRIAYLIRVRRQDPGGILVLSYNRHAAAEIRVRLRHLIGEDANGVTVSTCHALAMRLVGASFAGLDAQTRDFDGIVREAARLLRGDGLVAAEAEAQRDTLIQGYRWILVDEYQDIGPEEYELIAAVAGRTIDDPDMRLSLFAVGDDDQNIYAFAGASIRYIRAFEQDYRARPEFLIENYRSSANIIAAANAVIAPAGDRMKAGQDIAIARAHAARPPGGELEAHDPVAAGRVQILDCPQGDIAQGAAALDELERLRDPARNRRHVPEPQRRRLARQIAFQPRRGHQEQLVCIFFAHGLPLPRNPGPCEGEDFRAPPLALLRAKREEKGMVARHLFRPFQTSGACPCVF